MYWSLAFLVDVDPILLQPIHQFPPRQRSGVAHDSGDFFQSVCQHVVGQSQPRTPSPVFGDEKGSKNRYEPANAIGIHQVKSSSHGPGAHQRTYIAYCCLLYTSDAADDLLCVDLGGRRIIKKKKKVKAK